MKDANRLQLLLSTIGFALIALCMSASAASTPQVSHDDELRSLLGPELTAEIEQWDAAFVVAQREHATALAARGDARSLLGAVLMYPRWSQLSTPFGGALPQPPKVRRWFVQARDAAPDDALLAWLEATSCPVDAHVCDRTAALQRLRRIDPGNAAVWLEIMRDSTKRGDEDGADHAFRQAAQSDRHDGYVLPFGKLLVDSAHGLTTPEFSPELRTALSAFSEETGSHLDPRLAVDMKIIMIWNSLASGVDLQTPASHCLRNSEPVGDDDHQAACRAVFSRMADEGGTLLTRMVGSSLMMRLASDGDAADHWRERYRVHRWQQDAYVTQVWATPPASYLKRVPLIGEVAAMELMLTETGVSLEPAADWAPDSGILAE